MIGIAVLFNESSFSRKACVLASKPSSYNQSAAAFNSLMKVSRSLAEKDNANVEVRAKGQGTNRIERLEEHSEQVDRCTNQWRQQ